jgi:hypothetical protein
MTATCTVAALRTVLRAALAATDRESPTGAQVHLHAGDGRICATATDRYVASHARLPADGDLHPVLIHREGATLILRLLEQGSLTRQVTIGRVGTRPGSRLYVRCNGRRLVLDVGHLGAWPAGIGNLHKILPDRTGSGQRPVAVDPHRLERLVAGIRPLVGEPPGRVQSALRIYTGPPGQPVRLEIGDWWLGVIMPISDRNIPGGSWADMPHVPLTLGDPS